MPYEINETHDPNLKSWVESANDPNTDFPIQNLPFCEFDYETDAGSAWSVGVVIGDKILNLNGCLEEGLLDDLNKEIGNITSLFVLENLLEAKEEYPWISTAFRVRMIELLSDQADGKTQDQLKRYLHNISECTFSI